MQDFINNGRFNKCKFIVNLLNNNLQINNLKEIKKKQFIKKVKKEH